MVDFHSFDFADNWGTIKRSMILNCQSHLMVSIDDMDRLHEQYHNSAEVEQLREELESADEMWIEADRDRSQMEERLNEIEQACDEIADDIAEWINKESNDIADLAAIGVSLRRLAG
jgi:hypothetical protein